MQLPILLQRIPHSITVNQTGCYVLSVHVVLMQKKQVFHRRPYTKVNGTSVSIIDVEKALENSKVGDKGSPFTATVQHQTYTYTCRVVPSGNAQKQSSTTPANDSSDDIWSQMFGW